MTDRRDPFREPTDDELAALGTPDDLLDDDELAALDRLDVLDLAPNSDGDESDGDEVDPLLLDEDDDADGRL